MALSTLQQVGPGGTGGGNLRRLGTILRERSWLILLCTLLGGALATAYTHYAPKRYAAKATVKYQTAMSHWLALVDRPDFNVATLLAETRGKLEDDALLRRVALAQQLGENPRYSGGLYGSDATDRAVAKLRRNLRIETPRDATALDIVVTDRSPELATRLANAVVEELLTEYARVRGELLEEISSRLRSMQDEIWREYRARQPVAAGAPGVDEAVDQRRRELQDRLRTMTTQLVEANLRRLELAGQLAQARELAAQPTAALQVPFIASQAGVSSARAALLQSQVALEEISERYKAKHPDYTKAAEARDTAQQALAGEIQSALAVLEEEVEAARGRSAELQQGIDAGLAEVARLSPPPAAEAAAVPSAALSEAEALRQIGERVMARLAEFQFSGDVILTPLRQTQRAEPPTVPVGQSAVRLLGTGLLAGLIVGLLMSLVFGYGDTSLKTVDEVEQLLNLPVLCVVPRLKDNDTELAAAEGFRSLRTSIAVSSKGKEPRLLQFTSTSPDEGKTFCALNFAVGLAQQGHKTVLVECDLRRPMAAPSLALVKVDAAGVSDFLKAASAAPGAGTERGRKRPESDLSFAEIRKKKGAQDDAAKAEAAPVPQPAGAAGLGVEAIVQQTEVPNLCFVAAGKPAANPTELLARPRFEDLLNGLLQRYDRVVLDSAPVLGVSETLLIANRMQGVCFVLRGGQTPRRAVVRAVEMMRRADVPVLGVVLNGLNLRRSDPYGQDYYYHRAAS